MPTFIVGFVGAAGLALFLSVAWPAIILGIGGLTVIHVAKSPAPVRTADAEHFDRVAKEQITIKSIYQSGNTMVATINNASPARIYNMILSCNGGPSLRDHSGWLKAGATGQRVFTLRDLGPHTGCILGYDVDYDEATRKLGHDAAARPYFDELVTTTTYGDGSVVNVRGTISNYMESHISIARIKCYFTVGDIDMEYLADIDVSINSKATGSVNSSFHMPNRPQNGIHCKAMNVVAGDTFK